MLPEALVITVGILPVGIHVRKEGGLPGGSQDLSDVGVGSIGVAVGVIGPIAVVRPISDQLTRIERVH